MELETKENGLRILTPSMGHWITQRASVPITDRIISNRLYLGKNDSVDNWYEITEEMRQIYLAELERWEREQEESETPEDIPEEEPTSMLDLYKEDKLKQLVEYDNSIDVNGFFVGESLTWIDRDTRNTYKASIEAAELLGETSIIVPILGMILNIPIEKGKIALAKIQRYADACAIVTAQHKMAISGLDSEEEIMGYDFTLGYPEKLVFDPTEYLN